MSNEQNVKEITKDAYMHQKVYEKKKARNKELLSWVFLAMSVFSLISIFVFPLYKYNMIDKKSNFSIQGNFTSVKIISEYFSKGFGDYAVLNTITMVSTVLIIAVMIYIVIGAAVSIFLKGKTSGWLQKITSYTALEIAAAIQFVLIIINMVATKVDVSGSATNKIEFWIVFILSFVSICFCISLSTPVHTDK